ncbi:TIGR02234 family membrane protein [Streptomyces somaliensis DSM 40738]|uniref:TIGR02234 family membrane protein n=2 Tax=Streptomyces somaliensis TaxID=78355 RepID=UPI0021C461C4|nr:TIGR02234 family membrane protein [Streptomyces somaliensis]MCP9960644.1 TIGR02234 family membrane protein [Streptomyces somaliensis]MCP9973419.1 TIGR02234 family membrane protein [Streptomyces somaliensis]MCQ0022326.1 TIGR02234 family membrane protein [Streptomyces somaliensis DSM 40738]
MGYVSAASVPQPRAAGQGEAVTAGSGRRSLAAALSLGALGAAAVLLASGRTWTEGRVTGVGGTVALEAAGGDVTGVPAALAVVGLAALVAVLATRGAGRRVVALLLALSGAGAAAAALLGADGGTALDERAARTTGDTAARATDLAQTAWPYVTAAAALLILAAGLIALRYGRTWPAMSGRYERDGGPRTRTARRAGDPDRPEELWKALDRGEDPTEGA